MQFSPAPYNVLFLKSIIFSTRCSQHAQHTSMAQRPVKVKNQVSHPRVYKITKEVVFFAFHTGDRETKVSELNDSGTSLKLIYSKLVFGALGLLCDAAT